MADFPDRPGYSFDPGPPPEASRFLRNKGMRPAFSWADVEPEEHAVAFTVAKATELDVLEAIHQPQVFSSGRGISLEIRGSGDQSPMPMMIVMDPPRHGQGNQERRRTGTSPAYQRRWRRRVC